MTKDSSILAPLPQVEWNRVAAAHLLNRTGFGALPAEMDAAVQQGLSATLDRLLEFHHSKPAVPPPAWVTPDAEQRPERPEFKKLSEEEKRMKRQELRRIDAEQMLELRAWWIQLMHSDPHPLREKLTLFWHGLFATSQQKVNSAYAMWRQNQTLRENAAGNWRAMLRAVSRDPAMLIWLDGARSQQRAPNENYARELMELFTLGEGHYTETDIREAARAFTGWTLERDRFTFAQRPRGHDDGEKTVLGVKGRLDGDGVIDAILAQPRAAEYLARRLWDFFVSPAMDDKAVAALADVLRHNNYEIEPALRALFASRIFYDHRFHRAHVKSPVQWMIGTLRILELPPLPPRRSDAVLRNLGQHLFEPPNVKGWDGGMSWITASSLLARYQMIGELFRSSRDSFSRLLPASERKGSWDDGMQRLCWLFFQDPLRPEDRSDLVARLPPEPPESWTERDVRDALKALMNTPHYQLV